MQQELSEYIRLRDNLAKLGLSKMAEYLPGYMDVDANRAKTATQIMRELTEAEIAFRDERAADMHFKLSNFPNRKTLDDFDYAYQPSVPRETVEDLRTLRFVELGENVLLIGTSGVGKTHIATGLGLDATRSHITTYFIHFRDLVQRLRRSIAEGREDYALRSFNKYKLLIIDEIGYFPVDRQVASLFFQLVAARYEKKSIIVTTNQPLSKWGELFADPVIANAIVDRLVHHSTIVKIVGRSYRVKGKIEDDGSAEPLGVDECSTKKK